MFQIIRPQLAVGAHKISASYGEILVKGWKELADMAVVDNDDTFLVHFEEMLQGLIHDCLHAIEQSYFRGLRFALGVFHEAKRLKGIDALLSTYTFSTIFGSATFAIFGATGNSYFWRKGSTHFRSRLARQICVVAARRSRSFAILSFVFWFSSLYFKKRLISFFAFLFIRL